MFHGCVLPPRPTWFLIETVVLDRKCMKHRHRSKFWFCTTLYEQLVTLLPGEELAHSWYPFFTYAQTAWPITFVFKSFMLWISDFVDHSTFPKDIAGVLGSTFASAQAWYRSVSWKKCKMHEIAAVSIPVSFGKFNKTRAMFRIQPSKMHRTLSLWNALSEKCCSIIWVA